MHIRSSLALSRRHLRQTTPWYPRMPCLDINNPLEPMDKMLVDVEREIQEIQEHMDSILRHCEEDQDAECVKIEINPQLELDLEGDKGKMLVHVGKDFSPKNINVILKDRQMTITATTERKPAGQNSRIYQKTSRTFTIPETMNVEQVRTVWNEDGVLCVEAPLQEMQALPQPMEQEEPEEEIPALENSSSEPEPRLTDEVVG